MLIGTVKNKIISAALLILFMANSNALAFSSVTAWEILVFYITGAPGGYIHRQITEEALAPLEINKDTIARIGDANWRTDWDEMKKQWPPAGNEHYNPAHHFDRNEPAACEGCAGRHAEAFLRGMKFLAEEKAAAVAALRGEEGKTPDDAVQAIGRGLHALQDLFSHSNIVDLSPQDLAAIERSLFEKGGPPAALKMAGFDDQHGGDLAGTPDLCSGEAGREYGHDACSKDDRYKNTESQKKVDSSAGTYDPERPERMKFDAARELAVKFSRQWVEQIRQEAGAAAWLQFRDAR